MTECNMRAYGLADGQMAWQKGQQRSIQPGTDGNAVLQTRQVAMGDGMAYAFEHRVNAVQAKPLEKCL